MYNLENIEQLSMKNFLKDRTFYSWGAFILIIAGDIFAFAAMRGDWSKWSVALLVILILIVFLWIIGWINDAKFGLKRMVLSKLLSNAIGLRWLSLLYLALFVIHVGWLGNVLNNLFSSSKLFEAVYSFGICVAVIVFLIIFFPDGRAQKEPDAKKVLISGISEIKVPYDRNYNKLNLIPLIRILQKYPLSECELLILRSDYNRIKDEDLSKAIQNVLEFVYDPEEKKDKNEREQYAKLLLDNKPVKEQLETLIKEVAKKEGISDINQLSIDWTVPCDYNVFKSCHDALAEKIRAKDDDHHRFIFYISPGTALVGSLITLMAIDGDRELFYYSQEPGKKDSDLLMPVDKKQIPLRNLLTQAFEKLETI